MNFRDTRVACEECGKQFFYTVEEQRRRAERGQDIEVPSVCAECLQRVKYAGRHHGRIKWFDPEKGYGFIAGDDGKEVFVHRNSVAADETGQAPTIEEGQEVLYDVADSAKGPQAVQVQPFAGQ